MQNPQAAPLAPPCTTTRCKTWSVVALLPGPAFLYLSPPWWRRERERAHGHQLNRCWAPYPSGTWGNNTQTTPACLPLLFLSCIPSPTLMKDTPLSHWVCTHMPCGEAVAAVAVPWMLNISRTRQRWWLVAGLRGQKSSGLPCEGGGEGSGKLHGGRLKHHLARCQDPDPNQSCMGVMDFQDMSANLETYPEYRVVKPSVERNQSTN